jgi:hypothetical protein
MTTADWYAASSALCIVAGTASVWVNYYRTWRAADELLKPDTAPGWAARQSRSDLVGEVEKSRVQAVTRRLQRLSMAKFQSPLVAMRSPHPSRRDQRRFVVS